MGKTILRASVRHLSTDTPQKKTITIDTDNIYYNNVSHPCVTIDGEQYCLVEQQRLTRTVQAALMYSTAMKEEQQ